METNSVLVSGPVSLAILRDPKTDRYFYFFGDVHASMENSCPAKGDSPNFLFTDVITTDSNCWTISALLHEVLLYQGERGVTVDLYLENATNEADPERVNLDYTRELLGRRHGVHKEPTNFEEQELMEKRLSRDSYGYLTEVSILLWQKEYNGSVRVINADVRLYGAEVAVPALIPPRYARLVKKINRVLENFLADSDRDEYRYNMESALRDVKEVFTLTEKIAEDPFDFFSHYFIPEDFVQATKEIIPLIPVKSSLCRSIINSLYKIIASDYGELSTDGVRVSPSAASWARLREINPIKANSLIARAKRRLLSIASELEEMIPPLRNLFEAIDFSNPEMSALFVSLLDRLYSSYKVMLVLAAQIMDHYVLSEMLQRTAKHNILFAGDGHTLACANFLITTGFQVIEKKGVVWNENGPVRCVKSDHLERLLSLYAARAHIQAK